MTGRILLVITLLACLPASGAVWSWTSTLTGDQETPPVVTPGSGTGMGTLDTDLNTLTWTITWSGILEEPGETQTNAHFHVAPPGVAGPVVLPLDLGSPISGSATITDADEADILAGLWYINIHTSEWPAGEIRGQVYVIPEPGTFVLFGAGLTVAVLLRRRMQRS